MALHNWPSSCVVLSRAIGNAPILGYTPRIWSDLDTPYPLPLINHGLALCALPPYEGMSTAAPPNPPGIERSDVHKSAKALEQIIALFHDYCQTISACTQIQRKLAKALKDAAAIKGTHPSALNAFAAAASLFEALADIEGRFSKICDREYEGLSGELKKWFKRMAKDVKNHDDYTNDMKTKIKVMTSAYDKKTKTKYYDVSTDQTQFNQIGALANQLHNAAAAHAADISEKHTAVLFFAGATMTRLADAEWCRSCEEVRKAAPVSGRVSEWRAHCESGFTGELPGDLVELNSPEVQREPVNTMNGRPEDSPEALQLPKTPNGFNALGTPGNLRRATLPPEQAGIAMPMPTNSSANLPPYTSPAFRTTSLEAPAPAQTPLSPGRVSPGLARPLPTPGHQHSSSKTVSARDSLTLAQPLPRTPLEAERGYPFPETEGEDTTRERAVLSQRPLPSNSLDLGPMPPQEPRRTPGIEMQKSSGPSQPSLPPPILRNDYKSSETVYNDRPKSSGNRLVDDRDRERGHPPSAMDRSQRRVGRSDSIDSKTSTGSHVAAMRERYGDKSSRIVSPPTREIELGRQDSGNSYVSPPPTGRSDTGAPPRNALPRSSYTTPTTERHYTRRPSVDFADRDRERDRDRDRISNTVREVINDSPRSSLRNNRERIGHGRKPSRDWPEERDIPEDRDREATLRRRQEELGFASSREDLLRSGGRDRERERERDVRPRGGDSRDFGYLDRDRERERERDYASDRDKSSTGGRQLARERAWETDRERDVRSYNRRNAEPASPTPRRTYSPPPPLVSRGSDLSANTTGHASNCGCHECSARYYATPRTSTSGTGGGRDGWTDREGSGNSSITSPGSYANGRNPGTMKPLNIPPPPPIPTEPSPSETSSVSGHGTGKLEKKGSSVFAGLRRLSIPLGHAFNAGTSDTNSSAVRSLMTPVTEEGRRKTSPLQTPTEEKRLANSMPISSRR